MTAICRRFLRHKRFLTVMLAGLAVCSISPLFAGTKTWDGKYDTSQIDLTVVYYVPSDRPALTDWKDRAEYYCRRLEQFHAREFQGQSVLKVALRQEPLQSRFTTAELRKGDGDAIFFKTLGDADRQLQFGKQGGDGFPILLVLSEINWRPLDDFYRLSPREGRLVFEGNYSNGEHFPGAESGGARATYLADRGAGWGLVSADGWRVPYRGSDCVIYHEGVGHTVGLPHPEPGDGSVMSFGQYNGWISESWLDKEQKIHMAWKLPETTATTPQQELFNKFRALPNPRVPRPGEAVTLELDWPADVTVKSLRVRYQTAIDGPWIDVPQGTVNGLPKTASLAAFDRPTPISYRVDAELTRGERAEIWGYFQVRSQPDLSPIPTVLPLDLIVQGASVSPSASVAAGRAKDEVDLLALIDPAANWHEGDWKKESGRVVSPKGFGTRIEIPYTPPEEYRLVAIIEPLDEPNGLILGQRSGNNRFLSLLNFVADSKTLSALENVNGTNVGNETTFEGSLFKSHRLSQVIVTVNQRGATVTVDGRQVIDWQGSSDQLSLSDYWKTPTDTSLFLGAYDCRYRFHRLSLEPISGAGKPLTVPAAK